VRIVRIEDFVDHSWARVADAARGVKADYRLGPTPISTAGGQAIVHQATHKATSVPVAFKKRRSAIDDAAARMRREVEVGQRLGQHPHVMPILDHNVDDGWFVMPLAISDASAQRASIAASEEAIRAFVEAAATGLAAAHELGWVHRDVKPGNFLLLPNGDLGPRWVVADWGLARRPLGSTTDAQRTRAGMFYGTLGFAPPELHASAHEATPAADVYSLGQMIGWLLTGDLPRPNIPHIPAAGPWRAVIKSATQTDPNRRPQTMAELTLLIASELDDAPADIVTETDALLQRANAGDATAGSGLLRLCARQGYTFELCIDILPTLTERAIANAVAADEQAMQEAVVALRAHLGHDWGRRNYKWADSVIFFLFYVAKYASSGGRIDLLEDAADALFAWDDAWNQWTPQPAIREWLGRLDGQSARSVARAIRRYPDSASHFAELADSRRADPDIRSAVRSN